MALALGLAAIVPGVPRAAQAPGALPTPVSVPGLLADAAILEHAYDALHPGLLRYSTPEEVVAHETALEHALRQSTSIGQAYLAFSRFTATVRCGHSYPNVSNQPKAVADALPGGTPALPFTFVWLHEHMIVTRNRSVRPELSAGADILSIDGHRASDILAALLPYVRADGSNDAKRINELNVTGRQRYEAFNVYFPLVFRHAGAAHEFEVRPFGRARTERVTVDAPAAADDAAPSPAPDTPLWTLTKPSASVAVLTMPTWVTYNSKWDWHAALEATFAALARDGTATLVIDLRGNEGGTDAVGDALLAHLIAAPLPAPAIERRVRYRRVPADLVPYLDTYDPSLKDWGEAAVPIDARFYRLERGSDGAPIVPAAPRFAGRVLVLVDAANSSATFQFAQRAQRNHVATLIGSPTGGNQRGINGSAFFFVRLPNSGIEVDLPLVGTFPRDPSPDAGLTPDVVVEPSQADIAGGRDAILARALATERH